MPIYRLIGTKWSISKNIVQAIDEKQPLLKILPLISRKLSLPSMKDYNFYSCNKKLQPVALLDIEESLADQGCDGGASGGQSALFIAPRDVEVELFPKDENSSEQNSTTALGTTAPRHQSRTSSAIDPPNASSKSPDVYNNDIKSDDDDQGQEEHEDPTLLTKAAVKIQSVTRQHQAKLELDQLKKEKQQREEMERRKRLEEQKQEEEAAIKIQSLMRQKIAKEELDKLKKEHLNSTPSSNNNLQIRSVSSGVQSNNERQIPPLPTQQQPSTTLLSNTSITSSNFTNNNNSFALHQPHHHPASLASPGAASSSSHYQQQQSQLQTSGGLPSGSYFGGPRSNSRQRSTSRVSNSNNNNNNARGTSVVTSGSGIVGATTPAGSGVGGGGGFSRAASLYVKSATLERELTGERVRAETAIQSSSQNRFTATMQTFLMTEVENRFRKVIIPERDARVELALFMIHVQNSSRNQMKLIPTSSETTTAAAERLQITSRKEDQDTNQAGEATQEELDAFEKMRSAQERQRELTNKLEAENIKLRRELQEARVLMQNQQREYENQVSMIQQQQQQQLLAIQQNNTNNNSSTTSGEPARRTSPDNQQQQETIASGGFTSPISPSFFASTNQQQVQQQNNLASNDINNNQIQIQHQHIEDMQDIKNQLETLRQVASREEGQLSALKHRLTELTKLYHGALEARDTAVQEREEMRSTLHEMETSYALEIQRVRRAAAGEVMTLQRALTAVDRDRTVNALHVGESIAQITQNTKRREQQQMQQPKQVRPQYPTSSSAIASRSANNNNNLNGSTTNTTINTPIGLVNSTVSHPHHQNYSQNHCTSNAQATMATPPSISSTSSSVSLFNNNGQQSIHKSTYEEGQSELRSLYDRFVTDGSANMTPKGWK